jgi:hypothetical protein
MSCDAVVIGHFPSRHGYEHPDAQMDTGNRTGWTTLRAGTRDDAVMSAVTALAGRNQRQESGTRTQ